MTNFTVIVAEQVYRDTNEAIFYKKSLESNISNFAKEVVFFINKLETSPNIGSNLSSRINIDTKIKYTVIQD